VWEKSNFVMGNKECWDFLSTLVWPIFQSKCHCIIDFPSKLPNCFIEQSQPLIKHEHVKTYFDKTEKYKAEMKKTYGKTILIRMSVKTIDLKTLDYLINEINKWEIHDEDKTWFFFDLSGCVRVGNVLP